MRPLQAGGIGYGITLNSNFNPVSIGVQHHTLVVTVAGAARSVQYRVAAGAQPGRERIHLQFRASGYGQVSSPDKELFMRVCPLRQLRQRHQLQTRS